VSNGSGVQLQTFDLRADALPYDLLGGPGITPDSRILSIVERFYDAMSELHPALAQLHKTDTDGRVDRRTRDRFGLFFIEWLGGPKAFSEANGHPRLRMRHAHVPVTAEMRDAWIACMAHAMDAEGIDGTLREFLDKRLYDVATFLINQG
jgi:hemoglobin